MQSEQTRFCLGAPTRRLARRLLTFRRGTSLWFSPVSTTTWLASVSPHNSSSSPAHTDNTPLIQGTTGRTRELSRNRTRLQKPKGLFTDRQNSLNAVDTANTTAFKTKGAALSDCACKHADLIFTLARASPRAHSSNNSTSCDLSSLTTARASSINTTTLHALTSVNTDVTTLNRSRPVTRTIQQPRQQEPRHAPEQCS